VFWSFRIMVGIGVLMVVLGLFSLGARYRRRLYDCGALHRFAMLMGPMGFVAVLAGWITTEVGRQPYTIYGLLRTADSISPIDAQAVGFSLLAFIVVYFAVFGAGTYYILRLMGKTPDIDEPDLERGAPLRAAGITPASALGGGSGGSGISGG
jgi:cytochrome d ubiquinol oxidase subunit I